MTDDISSMIREAGVGDVAAIQHLRLQVRENTLSDPSLVTVQMTTDAISISGHGWVFEESGQILGFSIALRKEASIWALFVHPDHEGRGIGLALFDAAVNWLWAQKVDRISLSTGPGTRAARFYRKAGWREAGIKSNGEIRFELTRTGETELD